MNDQNKPRILSINSKDLGGGAEKISLDLHRYYLALGKDSKLLVGHKKTDFPFIYEIPIPGWYQLWGSIDKQFTNPHSKGSYFLHRLVKIIKAPLREFTHELGLENYYYPESRRMVKKLQVDADIVHMHNLHNEYFDLSMLPTVSRQKPSLITLHDEYLYTGHCASSLGCERWRIGCAECPHLDIYPPVKRDRTHFNWERKKSLFSKSQVTLVTPSQWLAQRVSGSFLSHLQVKVIPNGIDLEIFKTGSQEKVRDILNLDQQAFIILFTAAYGRLNPFKDFTMLDRFIDQLKNQPLGKPVILIALGGGQLRKELFTGVWLIEVPFINDPKEIAQYYQACDLYIHPAKAETFGLAIIEAMACGKAVVATSVGGIPELVREGITGYMVPIGDDATMTERIISMINKPDQLKEMGAWATKLAQEEYDLKLMARNYLSLYQEIIEEKKPK